jgi:hypothetical protein
MSIPRCPERILSKRRRAILAALAFPLILACSDSSTTPTGDDGSDGDGVYDPPDVTENALTGELNVQRAHHTATLLQDGRVLVVGGVVGNGELTASSELYNPETETWSTAPALAYPRFGHRATRLRDGRVFVAGGSRPGASTLGWFEIFDPAAGTWSEIVTGDETGETPTSLLNPRSSHRATLLTDGRVLFTGGFSSYGGGVYLQTYEFYDPATNMCALGERTMYRRRNGHTATLLPDGTVLVAGGFNEADRYLTNCEIYDPAVDAWTPTGPLSTERSLHNAVLLADGRVLVVGGTRSIGSVPSCEVYDPAAGTWSLAGDLREIHNRPEVALLPDGRVFLAGNFASKTTEIYVPASGTWVFGAEMLLNRHHGRLTPFSNGVVLLSGGISEPGGVGYLKSCELYVP